MVTKNRYFRRSKISTAKFRQRVRHFALDLTAAECATLTGISVRSINTIYLQIRRRMSQWCLERSPLAGGFEADESYFGSRRVCGKRGRGAHGKTIVFGLLTRAGCVYTEIVPNASKATLQAIIRGKTKIASIIHTIRWRRDDGLVDIGFDKHFSVNHSSNAFARGKQHVNGALPNADWRSSTAFQNVCSPCI